MESTKAIGISPIRIIDVYNYMLLHILIVIEDNTVRYRYYR